MQGAAYSSQWRLQAVLPVRQRKAEREAFEQVHPAVLTLTEVRELCSAGSGQGGQSAGGHLGVERVPSGPCLLTPHLSVV